MRSIEMAAVVDAETGHYAWMATSPCTIVGGFGSASIRPPPSPTDAATPGSKPSTPPEQPCPGRLELALMPAAPCAASRAQVRALR